MTASAPHFDRISARPDDRSVWARASRGYTLLELLVAMSVFAVLLATALPSHHANRLQINNAQRLVISILRGARASAISKSVHFAVEFAASDRLLVQRMYRDDSGWHVDSAHVQVIQLSAPAYVAPSAVGTRLEFDSRGAAVNLSRPQRIELHDAFGARKVLQAWPSGQINEL